LLGAFLSPCCRYYPAGVEVLCLPVYDPPCCLRPPVVGSASGITCFRRHLCVRLRCGPVTRHRPYVDSVDGASGHWFPSSCHPSYKASGSCLGGTHFPLNAPAFAGRTTGHMGYTFSPFREEVRDAVEGVFGDGRKASVCRSGDWPASRWPCAGSSVSRVRPGTRSSSPTGNTEFISRRYRTDITGQTGLRIVRSILAGEHDPERLAAHRDPRCHASHAEIVAALTGNYRAEHLFALRQNFAAYEFLLRQIAECDGEIEALLTTLAAQQPPPSAPLPAPRKRGSKQPQFDIRGPLHRLTGGANLSQIDSIGPHAALQLIAEIGTDMRRWPTEKHFASWLALAPNNKISGGRLLSSRTPPSAKRAGPCCAAAR
jgi:transposase IS116/IS110/IS902 family protein